ncbi:MAG: hypothetical protein N2109_00450 [Fimbriimonadales bacterium]|nr:hypothetical protein [Fimbriimonadales bacterium]
MLGWVAVFATIFGAPGLLLPAIRRSAGSMDPAARIGVAGLASLGLLGTLTLFLGFGPVQLSAWRYAIPTWGLVGLWLWWRTEGWPRFHPLGGSGLGLLAPGVTLLLALVGALAPSSSLDWDSLSYHLAVPKLWLEAGRIERIPFIHHSNFPFAVDNLFLWGLAWAGESGAKMFSVGLLAYGLLAVFGLARELAGQQAAWWSLALFCGIPLVVWQGGTAYIDVAHGLFAGLGALLLVQGALGEGRRERSVWGGLLLGLAAGSKYTGLQFLVAAVLVAGVWLWASRMPMRRLAAPVAVALAVCGPWYVRNVFWSGNPVFPFFYEQLGGSGWDSRRAEIYRREQQTFGVGWKDGNLDKLAFGHAVLGLAYQPGRYVNPGQSEGRGFPIGSVGVALVAALVAGSLVALRGPAPWPALLAFVWLSLLEWFLLSQQSRYILALAAPIALLGGWLVSASGASVLNVVLRLIVAGQAAFSFVLTYLFVASTQIPVVLGAVSRQDYLAATVPFARPARDINEVVGQGKVALYDEVFGFLLDVPYVWANPGHSTLIPYDELRDGGEFVEALRRMGFTHVYANFAYNPTLRARAAEALRGFRIPRDDEAFNNWELKWSELLLEAIAEGRLVAVKTYGAPEKPVAALLAIP